jgi:hypothetical protein
MFFVGEFGMAAVHALGHFPGKHDRFDKEAHQTAQYDEVKAFIIRLFEKAGDYGVKLCIPVDFQCAKRPNVIVKDLAAVGGATSGLSHTGGSKEEDEKPHVSGTKPAEVGDTQGTNKSHALDPVEELVHSNPDMHWTDACYEAGRVRLVDLEEKVETSLNAI